MSAIILILGVILAIACLSLIPKLPGRGPKIGAVIAAAFMLFLGFFGASFRFVPEDRVGVVAKNAFGPSLPPGKIIATEGEKGPQATLLPPGWHPWLWPVIYDVELRELTVIEADEVGLLTAADGKPLPNDTTYAPEWAEDDRKRLAQDAAFFLTEGLGYRGPQTTVLEPGSYRINTNLFKVEKVPATNIEKATVGVVKSNVGTNPVGGVSEDNLVDRGQQGIWREPLLPRKYYLNPKAYEVTTISTKETIVEFTKEASSTASGGKERAITVRTSDGFEFPVDVRVVYKIEPQDAPRVVAILRDDDDSLLEVLQSSVRSIFRNNAQDVKALDYVQQRVQQEQRSTEMLRTEMEQYGISVTAVRIADLGDDSERWQALLKTQTDREIALQEQETFQEQQRAAEQKKELTRTEQEAEEEKRLATAKYEVQIAEQDKERRIIEANAEAEAIQIKADAQAAAYQKIAEQIGKGNAALVELLKIIGERGIEITPRVMVVGGEGGSRDAETTALIGTMLDTMVSRQTDEDRRAGGN